MILAATGHRPERLGGYDDATYLELRQFALGYIRQRQPAKVINGMALGWDTAWAAAAVYAGVPFIAAVPFLGQESRWPGPSQARYRALLAKAAEVVVVCQGDYSAQAMQRRNEWMVDRCDEVVALWDGSAGGTSNCVHYARRIGRPVENLWVEWILIGSLA